MAAKQADEERDAPDVAEIGDVSLVTGDLPGPPSGFTCPECGGALWELQSGRLLKYRCHVGHAYTPEGLVAEQARALEVALWTGLRALEEYAALRRRMARRARSGNWAAIALDYERQSEEAEARAALIRQGLIDDRVAPGKAGVGRDVPRPRWDGRVYNRFGKGRKSNGAKARPEPKSSPKKAGGRSAARSKAANNGNSGNNRRAQ